MEEKPKIKNTSNKENQNKLKQFPSKSFNDSNIEVLFQNSFRDKQCSTRLTDLYKKYNNKDRKSEVKTKLPVLTQQSTGLKLVSSKQKINRSVSASKNRKFNRKKLAQVFEKMYQKCSKSVMPERDKKFQIRLRKIILNRQSL